jgi:hypothetical protein
MLDLVFQALRRAGAPVAVIILVVLWPELILREALTARFTRAMMTGTADVGAMVGGAGWVVASALLGFYVGLVVSAAMVAVLSARDRGAALGTWGALKIGLARSGATVGASAMAAVALVVVASITLIVGAVLGVLIPVVGLLMVLPIVLLVALVGFLVSYLLVAVAVQEGVGPWRTLTRTVSLLRGGFWRAVLVTLLLLVLMVAVVAALFTIGALVANLMGELTWTLQVLGTGVFTAVSTPMFAAAGLILHRDLQVRGEAYDLRVRARALTGRLA